MYLSGSKWNTRKKRRRANPWRVLLLVALVGGAIYVERTIVPGVPPLFIPTATPTRSPASYVLEAESLFQSGKLEQAEATYREAIAVAPEDEIIYSDLARLQVLAGDYVVVATYFATAADFGIAPALLGESNQVTVSGTGAAGAEIVL